MPAELHYYRVPEEWTREQKLDFLRTHTFDVPPPEQEAAQAEEGRRRLDAPRRHPVRRPAQHIRAAADWIREHPAEFSRGCGAGFREAP